MPACKRRRHSEQGFESGTSVAAAIPWSRSRPWLTSPDGDGVSRLVVAEQGFEPRPKAPKTRVLPLHYSARRPRLSAVGWPESRRPEADSRLVPKVGFEPTRVFAQRCLRPPRLPFRHFGAVSIVANRSLTTSRSISGTRKPAFDGGPGLSWSGRRGSNSRPPPWQGGALPLSYFRVIRV